MKERKSEIDQDSLVTDTKPHDSDTDAKKSRRQLLTILGSGTIAVSAIPNQWTKPAVDSVLLPVHANTSGTDGDGSGGDDVPDEPDEPDEPVFSGEQLQQNGSTGNQGLMDLLVAPAHAGISILDSLRVSAYGQIKSNGTVDLQIRCEERFFCRESQDVSVSGGLFSTNASGGNVSGSIVICGSSRLIEFSYEIGPNNQSINVNGSIFKKAKFEIMMNPGGSALSGVTCVECPIIEPDGDMFLQL